MRGAAAAGAPRATLSAPHDDVSATVAEVAGADKFGNVVTYTMPSTRNIRLIRSGGLLVSPAYKLNGGASTVLGFDTNVSMANGDTLSLGIAFGSEAGVKTITVRDMTANVNIDTLTLTVT